MEQKDQGGDQCHYSAVSRGQHADHAGLVHGNFSSQREAGLARTVVVEAMRNGLSLDVFGRENR